MNDDRRAILQMLADGTINADEAERLITALEKGADTSLARSDGPSPNRAKYLRVLVEAHDHQNRLSKINVRVPMQLLRAGMRLSSLIPAEARDQVNAAMREKGVAFDINQLKPENLEELLDQLNDLTVDVDDDRAKVRVFCE